MQITNEISARLRTMLAAAVAIACAACGPDAGKHGTPPAPAGAAPTSSAASQALAPESFKQPIKFPSEPLPAYVKRTYGIGQADFFGRWTTGKLAIIELNGSLPDKFEVVLVAGGFGPNVNAKARIIVGAVAKEFLVTGDLGAVGTHVLEFDGAAGESIIALEIATPTSPAALGKGDDHRKLGLALVSMAITPRP